MDYPNIQVTSITAQAFRYPVKSPVRTSFGVMRDRPAVFVRIEASNGQFGWGEVFANWPSAGAEHRARLLIEDISDLLIGKTVSAPSETFHALDKAVHIRALQCGEWGPFRQALAGIDTAMHDLFARTLGIPVRHMINPDAPDHVPAYASGIYIRDAQRMIAQSRAAGFSRFKVKVGFEPEQDFKDVSACVDDLHDGEHLMLDANQAWSPNEAIDFINRLNGMPITWVEEPLPADAPMADWHRVRDASTIPLAGGENLAGFEDFARSIAQNQFTYYQPDIAKWGGFTGCAQVANSALKAGKTFCPHFLGGSVGLEASAQLLAAIGGPGWLEIDINPNPLRDGGPQTSGQLDGGNWQLSNDPGLGLNAPADALSQYKTLDLTA